MFVKHITDDVFDVFFGSGWENWCRFKLVVSRGRKHLNKVGGIGVPAEVMGELRQIYQGA